VSESADHDLLLFTAIILDFFQGLFSFLLQIVVDYAGWTLFPESPKLGFALIGFMHSENFIADWPFDLALDTNGIINVSFNFGVVLIFLSDEYTLVYLPG
jgi:hypothetical protein